MHNGGSIGKPNLRPELSCIAEPHYDWPTKFQTWAGADCSPQKSLLSRVRSQFGQSLSHLIEGVHDDFTETCAAVEGVFGKAAYAPITGYADHIIAGE